MNNLFMAVRCLVVPVCTLLLLLVRHLSLPSSAADALGEDPQVRRKFIPFSFFPLWLCLDLGFDFNSNRKVLIAVVLFIREL
jgi:hypothetical protein